VQSILDLRGPKKARASCRRGEGERKEKEGRGGEGWREDKASEKSSKSIILAR
jgi:hypothetical protein